MHLHASSDVYLSAMPMNVVGGLDKGAPEWVAKSVSADSLSLTVEGQPGGYHPRQATQTASEVE